MNPEKLVEKYPHTKKLYPKNLSFENFSTLLYYIYGKILLYKLMGNKGKLVCAIFPKTTIRRRPNGMISRTATSQQHVNRCVNGNEQQMNVYIPGRFRRGGGWVVGWLVGWAECKPGAREYNEIEATIKHANR
jgi:hypothetical protein